MTAHTRDELDIRYRQDMGSEHLLEELDKLPSLFGGDGWSLENPVIVNSTSKAMSERLMKEHISKFFGPQGANWRVVEREVTTSSAVEGYIERHVAEHLEGRRAVFYFDLSRSHGGSLGLLRRAYEMRVLADSSGGLRPQ